MPHWIELILLLWFIILSGVAVWISVLAAQDEAKKHKEAKKAPHHLSSYRDEPER